jgi:hypothetical protein
LFVVFWKGSDLLLEELNLYIRSRFEAFEAFADIGEEAGFGEFIVGNNVNTSVNLFADDVNHGDTQSLLKRGRVVRLAGIFRPHCIEQPMRSRQTADMRNLDSISVLL